MMSGPGPGRSLVVHAHLYQPPREDPFLDEIVGEPSAAPYSNWNEKITAEAYRPLSRARILSSRNRIEEIVNLYGRISFNVGPTLAAYLEKHAPEVIESMREGDEFARRSVGFGNAIAQVYNHIIMPLADERDRWTEIVWGIADFERRFGRRPEALWLAETAVDLETAADLVRAGMRFVILSPHQIAKVSDEKGGWIDVSDGSIDPREPYILETPSGPIAVFAYDGGLASGVSFEHLLRSGEAFLSRIESAFGKASSGLVHLATDGEVYGHHEPFGEMCLAYLIERLLPRTDIRATNYAAYLDARPPERRILLKDGGSSWSCVHGVERWRSDCGCSTGGREGWNQKWRTPLREGLDDLRDRLKDLFEREGSILFKDPWGARDRYIEVILSGSDPSVRDRFLSEELRENPYAAGDPSRAKMASRALRLLESQRNALLIFTSCGWFFFDISGIETIQVMKYAARAISVLEEDAPEGALESLLLRLGEAKSNIEAHSDGRTIFERETSSQEDLLARIAHTFLMRREFEDGPASDRIYAFEVEDSGEGRVLVRDGRTLAEWEFGYKTEGEGFLAGRTMIETPGGLKTLGAEDLYPEERRGVFESMTIGMRRIVEESLAGMEEPVETLLNWAGGLLLPLPPVLEPLALLVASTAWAEAAVSGDEEKAENWRRLIEKVPGLELDRLGANTLMTERITAAAERIKAEGLESGASREAAELLERSRRLGIYPEIGILQEVLFERSRRFGLPAGGATAKALEDLFNLALLESPLDGSLHVTIHDPPG